MRAVCIFVGYELDIETWKYKCQPSLLEILSSVLLSTPALAGFGHPGWISFVSQLSRKAIEIGR